MAAEPAGTVERIAGGGLERHGTIPVSRVDEWKSGRREVIVAAIAAAPAARRAASRRLPRIDGGSMAALVGGAGKGTSRTSLLLASKHSIWRCSAGTLSSKPTWMVMLDSLSIRAISLRLRLFR